MPGWGDRGQHEGGWCKVREGREEGAQGRNRRFRTFDPGLPPPLPKLGRPTRLNFCPASGTQRKYKRRPCQCARCWTPREVAT